MEYRNKKDFEDRLDKTIYGGYSEKDLASQQQVFFKKRNALIYKTIVMLVIVFAGVSLFSVFYNNKTYNENSNENISMVHNAVQLAVKDHYYKTKSYPVTADGKIDFDKLQKEGYLLINIEGYKGKFSFNQNFQVLRTD